MGETSLCRRRLEKYCEGMGLDIGYGGDPIVPSAITLDLDKPYIGNNPQAPQHLKGTCKNLYWYKDNVLDYIYSSHLLEDFTPDEIKWIFWEWVRVIKPEGYIVLYLPDEQRYRTHCEKKGTRRNANHKIDNFSLLLFKTIVGLNLPITKKKSLKVEIVHENPICEDYSFEVVFRKKLIEIWQ